MHLCSLIYLHSCPHDCILFDYCHISFWPRMLLFSVRRCTKRCTKSAHLRHDEARERRCTDLIHLFGRCTQALYKAPYVERFVERPRQKFVPLFKTMSLHLGTLYICLFVLGQPQEFKNSYLLLRTFFKWKILKNSPLYTQIIHICIKDHLSIF